MEKGMAGVFLHNPMAEFTTDNGGMDTDMEKEILELFFWGTDDTYGTFLKTMNSIAGDRAGVRQALDYIHSYKGNGWNSYPNELKQYEWLQKLLPRLR